MLIYAAALPKYLTCCLKGFSEGSRSTFSSAIAPPPRVGPLPSLHCLVPHQQVPSTLLGFQEAVLGDYSTRGLAPAPGGPERSFWDLGSMSVPVGRALLPKP